MLKFLTAGESHGRCLVAILEGMPAGLKLRVQKIDAELRRRQSGYGRGMRMKIEQDKVEILSGIRRSLTIGSPIAILIENKDKRIDELPSVTSPRPGHADLAGAIKYGFKDIRDVLERSSARETAARVAVGVICKTFLEEFKIRMSSQVLMIGGAEEENAMKRKIDEAVKRKDTVGGIFEVMAKGLPVGLGSYVHYDRRLDGRLALNLMSIPGIKAVEFGLGFGYAAKFGSEVHDAIYYTKQKGFFRKTNNAGGIEGGMTNGEPLIIHCCMKPISTLGEPLDSVDIITKKPTKAAIERADICVVEAAAVIGEAVVAFEIANAFVEKFGGDSLRQIKVNYAKGLN
jgi:chorismate synthase